MYGSWSCNMPTSLMSLQQVHRTWSARIPPFRKYGFLWLTVELIMISMWKCRYKEFMSIKLWGERATLLEFCTIWEIPTFVSFYFALLCMLVFLFVLSCYVLVYFALSCNAVFDFLPSPKCIADRLTGTAYLTRTIQICKTFEWQLFPLTKCLTGEKNIQHRLR